MCTVSAVMDDDHWEASRGKCFDKHSFYHWQGRYDNRACLISDSLGKWIRDISHLEVKATPGLTIDTAIEKLSRYELDISGYDALLFLLGTNDFEDACDEKLNLTTQEIVDKMLGKFDALLTHVRQVAPRSRLGFSMIIPRPKDTKPKMDEDRREFNAALKKMCKAEKVAFLNTYRGVKTNGLFDKTKYARDKLHLGQPGIAGVTTFLRGATAGLLRGTGRGQNYSGRKK
jgi:lysophospholipase L1-like esterase